MREKGGSMDSKDIKRLEELQKNSGKSSNGILKESFLLLSIQELGKTKFIFVLMISIILSCGISIQNNAALLLNEVANTFETVVLAIFGIAFTAHSIFQALLSPKLIYEMVRTDDNEDVSISSFSGSNSYFVNYMMLSFVMVIINIFIIIIYIIIPHDWNLFANKVLNDGIFFLFCVPYFYCSIGWLIEIKSLISNISNMYNVSAMGKYIEEIKKKDNI